MNASTANQAALFGALAEPSRRNLLQLLLAGPLPVNALVEGSGMSQPLVSKHLRILKTVGLVDMHPDGQRRLYSVNAAPLKDLDSWLEPYRAFWEERLDALEQHLHESEALETGEGEHQ